MSFLGNLLKIVAIGAFFIATGPFGMTVGSTLATALRIGGAVLGYLGALVDRPQLLTERQRIWLSTTLEPQTPIPVVYGRAKVGAIVADWFIQPVNDFKELYYVAVFCHGSRDGLGVAGVDEVWIDNRPAIDLTTSPVARIWPYKPITANYKVFLGSTVQNVGATRFYTDGSGIGIEAPADVGGSGWSLTTDTGKGICCIGFVFVNLDTSTFSEASKTITTSSVANPTVITTSTAHGFATGDSVRIQNHTGSTPDLNSQWVVTVLTTTTFSIPEIVTVAGSGGTAKRFSEGPVFRGPPSVSAIIRGNRIYDTRTDLWTAGGDNPPMCIRDYLLSEIYGCGFDQTLIHEQSFKDAATYADALVSYVVGAAITITSSDAGTDRVLTAAAHGYVTGTRVRIAGHAGSTPSLNGDWTITVTTTTTFTLDGVNITVGGTGGTVTKLVRIKRFTCNGVLDTSRPTSDTLQELLSSCRGNLIWEQGQFKLSIRSDAAPAATLALTPANILGEWSFRNAGQEEKWNTVKASYIEPANGEFKSQEVQWPLAGTTNAYLATDNSFTNSLELALAFTNDQLMAQAIAQVTLNEARHGISVQVRCTEEALSASVGDLVTVTHPTPGWTAKIFWVVAMQLLPDTSVAMSLQEYDPTAYALDTMEDRRTFPATEHDSIFDVPPPGAVTGTALNPQGLRITWVSANYGLIDYYEVQAKCVSCGDQYTTIATPREGVLEAVAAQAKYGQNWLARVRVVNTAGWPSEWVESSTIALTEPGSLAPGTGSIVFTGYAPSVVATVSPPDLTAASVTPSGGDMCFSGGSWTMTVFWTVTGSDDTRYQIDIDEANDAAGVSYTSAVTGLTTVSSSLPIDTGNQGNLYGVQSPTTYYRKYKVKLVRKSDSAVIEFMETSQESITFYSENCA